MGADSHWTANLHTPVVAALRTRDASLVEAALRHHFKEASEHLAAAWTARLANP
jgi:DNA-binding GntR family transcriptional regulator